MIFINAAILSTFSPPEKSSTVTKELSPSINKLNDALLIRNYESTQHASSDFNTFYQFLDEILFLLDQNYHPYYLLIFRVKLLYLLGIGPVFSKCVLCGERDNLIGFDFLKGGMKCATCASNAGIYHNQEVIQLLRLLYLTKLEDLSFELLKKLPDLTTETSPSWTAITSIFLGLGAGPQNHQKDVISGNY